MNIKHPVAQAVAAKLTGYCTPVCVDTVKTLVGKGIEGAVNGQTVQAGNCHWLKVQSHAAVISLSRPRRTLFCVKIAGEMVAVFALTNAIRPEASTVVKTLQTRGIKLSIISGDDIEAVYSVAQDLEIPLENVRYRCSPQDKRNYILSALGPSHKNTVIFIGDGTNDAIALKQATIGIHMPSSTSTSDIAKAAASVILLQPNLFGILTMLEISKAAYTRIKFNFAWAICYNMVALTFAAGAWVKIVLPPAYAALGELVSVLPVVLIALQLRFVRFGKRKA